jgi:hypothetical protein
VLSGWLILVTGIAGVWTVFGERLLSGPAVSNGSARGTALVMLIAAIAVLPASMMLAGRGSVRALACWLGSVAYLVYNAVLLLFGTPFNRAFLLYAAILGLGIWSAIVILRSVDHEAIRDRFPSTTPVRAIAGYLWLIGALNALVWLRAIVPAVFAPRPMSLLDGTGMTTNPVYVQDLAFWLPLAVVLGVALWRRVAWAHLGVGSMLVFWLIESVGVATDQWFGHRADPASGVASAAAVWLFAALTAIGLVPLLAYLKGVRRRE